MIIIALSTIAFIIILALKLHRDGKLGRGGINTNHNNQFWIRVWLCLASIFGYSWELAHHKITLHLLWQVPFCAGMVGLMWMVMFNGLYNTRRHQQWFFPGTPGPEDGVMEKNIYKYPWLQHLSIILLGAFITFYIHQLSWKILIQGL